MRLVIGLGTGRSGSASLARFFGAQPGAFFAHEGAYARPRALRYTFGVILPWEPSAAAFAGWQAGLERAARGAAFYGDVGSYFLPYVGRILEARPEARFVCIERDRAEVVASFLRKSAGIDPWRAGAARRSAWDPAFPSLAAASKAAAIGSYWDLYRARAALEAQRRPERFRIFSFARLNERATQEEMLDFAGFPREGRRYRMPRANGAHPAGLEYLGNVLGAWTGIGPRIIAPEPRAPAAGSDTPGASAANR
jgi:hypothetical protein